MNTDHDCYGKFIEEKAHLFTNKKNDSNTTHTLKKSKIQQWRR